MGGLRTFPDSGTSSLDKTSFGGGSPLLGGFTGLGDGLVRKDLVQGHYARVLAEFVGYEMIGSAYDALVGHILDCLFFRTIPTIFESA